MEAERVAVSPDETYEWFDGFNSVVGGSPREFVFNVDELGCSGHSDSEYIRIIVSIDFPEPLIPVPYDRHSKHSIFVASIAADRFLMGPFMIVPPPLQLKESGNITDTMCQT
jgi:hypothetical protein